MSTRGLHPLVIVLLALLIAVPGLAGPATTPPSGQGQSRGPAPCAEGPSPWTDSLDDLSHVYVPEGGLVNVEVAGGEANLKTGATEGWIASEVITCPAGYRYDLVLLEAETPGASEVQISILNASKESSEIGFANETVPSHVKAVGTEHSVYDISPWDYLQIRVQVNLVASEADWPRLLAWNLYYVALDEWCDEYVGLSKMAYSRNLNLSGGHVEVNLTEDQVRPALDYEAYPTLAYGSDGVYLLYPNALHTGYEDFTKIPENNLRFPKFGDLNDDGILELVASSGATIPTTIFWGSTSDRYSTFNKSELVSATEGNLGIGDFNGDGWNDIIVGSSVFLNKGKGTFNSPADISLNEGAWLNDVGDVNGDGYDDILESECLYYGGPDGPSSTPDITVGTSEQSSKIKDVDLDGIDDIITINYGTSANCIDIYLGRTNAFDNTSDCHIPNIFISNVDIDAGDINGDGFMDIVLYLFEAIDPYPNSLRVFEGTAGGWITTSYHTVMTSSVQGSWGMIETGDIDKDGYDDIVIHAEDATSTTFSIYLGNSTWPTSPYFTRQTSSTLALDIAIGIPKGYRKDQRYAGSFTTIPIDLPKGKKWDVLHLDGEFPKNTSMEFSILDGSGRDLSGYRKLSGTDADLSGITLEPTIRVRVTLRSEFNWTTPVLERLTVKWMDKGLWRDQFYGATKSERMFNLGTSDGELSRSATMGKGPQLLFTSLKRLTGYDVRPQAYIDGGDLDYATLPPVPFDARGVSAVDATDVNGDGFMDVAFAVRQTGDMTFDGQSPLFLGSAVGWRTVADHGFPTTGASGVLLRDLNIDGEVDLVFAEEFDGTSYRVNTTLYWGRQGGGWNLTPDVQFTTNGASGVVAADLDGDGDLDLAFSCRRDDTTTSTNSMVFLQGPAGFCGTVPSYVLPTRGAAAVTAGDVNGDDLVDLAFANSISGGSTEIDSYVYLGKVGGGFEATPVKLKTAGAEDVELADLDGDGEMDLVFANMKNNLGSYKVDSYVYLNDGTGNFPATPSVRLSTTGAAAVAVADLDGTGRKDLVFACQYDGASYNVSSVAYLGGASGWSATPDIVLPTVGASDVLVAHLLKPGVGGYLSKAIAPEDPANTGAFHTFRYTANLGIEQSGKVQLIDTTTWEVLAETALQSGTHEWLVRDAFKFKEHQSVRVLVSVSGLDKPGEFILDNLWLNWTPRVKRPPQVLNLTVSSPSVYRLQTVMVRLNATDEYDPAKDLWVTLEHRLNGTEGPWAMYLLMPFTLINDIWTWTLRPKADASVGFYEFRVSVTDRDGMSSGYVVFPGLMEVLNNRPTAPGIRLDPVSPITTSTLQATIVTPSVDVESGALTYHYKWYRDGVIQENQTSDTVLSVYTTRGENWSVEIRAFDGLDEGPPGMAWVVIGNAAPFVKRTLPNPELIEDTPDDQWLNLANAFEDPDGDPLTWTVSPTPQHITVTIDPAKGKVTLVPETNWNGDESVTFVASDGQLSASQTVLVTVTAVDDPPVITTVNGQLITSDPIAFSIDQGELLVIQLGTSDVEDDELSFSVNSTAVQIDESTGEVRFQPGNDVVGTIRFAVTMTELKDPTVKVKLNFAVTVVNVNDPPAEPQITSPRAGARYKVDTNLTLVGLCTDPDTANGQVLNYTWSVNGTSRWYGPSVTVSFNEPGNYTITLTVSDGEFQRSASVGIEVTKDAVGPPPVIPPEEEHEGIPYALIVGAIVAVCVIMLVAFMLVSRRRAAELEAADEVEEKKEAFKHMAAEVGATAAQMEREVAEAKAAMPAEAAKPTETTKVVIETRGPDGKFVISSAGVPEQTLAVQPKETEAASKETERLFSAIGEAGPAVSAEEQERLRIENLKRRYQTAISRLPYGIPSAELKGKDWTWIAGALATGERKDLPDGREVTLIEGRWYFSDVKDASTFLTEYGARPRVELAKAPTKPTVAMTDKSTLLAKLDERYILGEISEEKYEELKKKLEDDGK